MLPLVLVFGFTDCTREGKKGLIDILFQRGSFSDNTSGAIECSASGKL